MYAGEPLLTSSSATHSTSPTGQLPNTVLGLQIHDDAPLSDANDGANADSTEYDQYINSNMFSSQGQQTDPDGSTAWVAQTPEGPMGGSQQQQQQTEQHTQNVVWQPHQQQTEEPPEAEEQMENQMENQMEVQTEVQTEVQMEVQMEVQLHNGEAQQHQQHGSGDSFPPPLPSLRQFLDSNPQHLAQFSSSVSTMLGEVVDCLETLLPQAVNAHRLAMDAALCLPNQLETSATDVFSTVEELSVCLDRFASSANFDQMTPHLAAIMHAVSRNTSLAFTTLLTSSIACFICHVV